MTSKGFFMSANKIQFTLRLDLDVHAKIKKIAEKLNPCYSYVRIKSNRRKLIRNEHCNTNYCYVTNLLDYSGRC